MPRFHMTDASLTIRLCATVAAISAFALTLVGCSETPTAESTTVSLREAEQMTSDAVTPLVKEIKMLNDALDEANETITLLERKLNYANRECEQLTVERNQLQQRVDSLGQQFTDLTRAVGELQRSLDAIQELLPANESSNQDPSDRQAMRDSDDD